MSPEHRRLTHALLLSLLIHASLLGLTFGGQGMWRPGFGFPWQERRTEAPDLRVVVAPPQVTAAEPAVTPVAEPSQQAWVERSVASRTTPTPSASRAPIPQRTTAAIVPKVDRRAEANPRTDAPTGGAPAQTPLRGDRPGDTSPPSMPAPAVIAVAPTDETTWVAPATPVMPPPVIAAAPSVSIPETATPSLRDAGDAAPARIDQEAPDRAVEPAKLDPSKQEGQRQAEQLEAARQDVARQEAAQAKNAREEAARQEAARQEAERKDAERKEAERKEAERKEVARKEAERKEAERTQAERTETERKETERKEAERKEGERRVGER